MQTDSNVTAVNTDSQPSSPPPTQIPYAETQPKRNSLLRDVIETLVLIIVVVTISQTVLANYVIQQESAYPNFLPNQRVFVDKVVYRAWGLNRGDVVVVHSQNGGDDLFKRVVGLPGEEVDIRENKVYINGALIVENYLAPGANSDVGVRGGLLPMRLADDEYFLMGDNRSFSQDSRSFGPFHKDKLVGRVWLRYWPLNTFMLVRGVDYVAPASGATNATR
jgi:signal peptidase I